MPNYVIKYEGIKLKIIKSDTLDKSLYLSYFVKRPSFRPTVTYDLKTRPVSWGHFRFFIFYSLLVILFFFSFLFSFFKTKWKIYFQNFNNISIAYQSYRDQQSGYALADMLVNTCFALLISLAITGSVFYNKSVEVHDMLVGYFGVFIAISLIFGLRSVIMHIIAFVFSFKEEVRFYNYNNVLIYKISIFALIPFCVLLLLKTPIDAVILQYMLGFIFTSIICIGWYRGIYIIRKKISNMNLHFILYFCTFEFLLVAVVIKFVSSFI
jgi:hypothetical protein